MRLDTNGEGPVAVKEPPVRKRFLDEVCAAPGGETIRSCVQCGTCSASCPFAPWMERTPRMMILLAKADRREAVLKANTIWICASCYLCTVRCPSGVEITNFMHALDSLATRAGLPSRRSAAQKLHSAFIDSVKKNGRCHELGAMFDFYRHSNPLKALKALPVGLALFTRGRLSLKPNKIKQAKELAAIIESAESDGRSK